jgi:hypothetical protein
MRSEQLGSHISMASTIAANCGRTLRAQTRHFESMERHTRFQSVHVVQCDHCLKIASYEIRAYLIASRMSAPGPPPGSIKSLDTWLWAKRSHVYVRRFGPGSSDLALLGIPFDCRVLVQVAWQGSAKPSTWVRAPPSPLQHSRSPGKARTFCLLEAPFRMVRGPN